MLLLSKLLLEKEEYNIFTERFLSALFKEKISPIFVDNTKDIWMRDYMPVKTKSGRYISFRYEPSYLSENRELQTRYDNMDIPITVYRSNISLDGGNVVFSPSKEKVIISDRIFTENPEYEKTKLLKELEKILEAKVIIIESLVSDMTGHTDGMVRFVNESTLLINESPYKNGLEQRIKKQLCANGFNVIDFPYSESKGISAEGCYLNYYETPNAVFITVSKQEKDKKAVERAKKIFDKKIVPIEATEIACNGGCLNWITWDL